MLGKKKKTGLQEFSPNLPLLCLGEIGRLHPKEVTSQLVLDKLELARQRDQKDRPEEENEAYS